MVTPLVAYAVFPDAVLFGGAACCAVTQLGWLWLMLYACVRMERARHAKENRTEREEPA